MNGIKNALSRLKRKRKSAYLLRKAKKPNLLAVAGAAAWIVILAEAVALGVILYPGFRDGSIRMANPDGVARYALDAIMERYEEEETFPFLVNLAAQNKAGKSALTLQCYDKDNQPFRTGGGVMAFTDRTFITSYSLAASSLAMQVVTEGNIIDVERLVAWDKDLDIAILEAENPIPEKPLSIGNRSQIHKGDEVIVPTAGQHTFLRMSVREADSESGLFALSGTLPRIYGVGAVLDSKGQLGALAIEPGDAQNVSDAVSIDAVQRLYDNRGNSKELRALFIERNPNVEQYYWNSQKVALTDALDTPEKYDNVLIRFEAELEPVGNSKNDGLFYYRTVKPDGREFSIDRLDNIQCTIADRAITESKYGCRALVCGTFHYNPAPKADYKQSDSDDPLDQATATVGNIFRGAKNFSDIVDNIVENEGKTVSANLNVMYFEVLED